MPPPFPPGFALSSADGVAAALMRSTDWSATAVGPVEQWPVALKTIVGVMLHSRQPMFLWWGPELIQFYNDAYIPSFGVGKHPAAMGQRGADCWQEIWPIIWPQIDDAMSRGIASWHEDQLVPIFRNGRIEDVYWTYGYSPVPDDSGRVGGTLVVCSESTSRVVAERRQTVVRTLADAMSDRGFDADIAETAATALRSANVDVPAALFYRRGDQRAPFVRRQGIGADPQLLDAADRQVQSLLARSPELVAQLGSGNAAFASGIFDLPASRGPEPVRDALLVPARGAHGLADLEFAAYGLNPRIPFDAGYREFLTRLTGPLSLAKARGDAARVRETAQAELNNLLLQAPVAAAVLIGPELVFELANPLYCRILGRRHVIGKRFAEVFPELQATELPAILHRVYDTGVGYSSPETPIALDRSGDGVLEDCHFEFNLEPIRNLGGAVRGLMAIAVDVTAQVAARQALERSNAERQRLLDAAEAASRAKDEFLAMLGHELRNPLAPIVTALQVMRRNQDDATQKQQALIQRQVDHLVRLVDDLLDVSTIARGKVHLKRSATPLADVIARSVEIAGHLLEERHHIVSVDVEPQAIVFHGDAARLAQVIANLLTNAARYTPPNGRIEVVARVEDGAIVIRVSDDGIGISPELLPHIFEMFYQGRRGVDRAEGGLGLGLALVKNLVAMHGGSVEACSAGENRGSVFAVRLPLAPEPAEAATGPAPLALQPTTFRRILVVDDNHDAADSLAEMLRLDGHTVQVAFEAMTALALAEHFRPEVALLDIGLPGMNGHELARRFRERFDRATCALIALTGYGQAADRARSAEAGFDAHLVKPVDMDELRAMLRDNPTGTIPQE